MNIDDNKLEHDSPIANAPKSAAIGQITAHQIAFAPPVNNAHTATELVRETSPQGRYVKLEDRLGSGAYKDVWRAYDTNEGIEVAWNVVKLSRTPPSERKRIKTEVKLLKDIQHKNVIKYYNSWVDREKEQIVFITEIMSSGSLKDYLRKNPMIRWNAVKRWCRQILRGLEFLHTQHVIHRDIKCDNIFINGATGDLRIGDLGLSTKISEHGLAASLDRPITAVAMTCLGTPEFMAPEMYEENYNEKVDIYAFGMCLLEMVTGLMPYHDCTSAPQIYKKVLNGELPPELDRVAISNIRAADFIQACLQQQDKRPSATELLAVDFLKPNEAEDYMEVRLTRNPINAIAEQDEEYDDDDVPQNEMDGPKKSRIVGLEGNTVEGESNTNSGIFIPDIQDSVPGDLSIPLSPLVQLQPHGIAAVDSSYGHGVESETCTVPPSFSQVSNLALVPPLPDNIGPSSMRRLSSSESREIRVKGKGQMGAEEVGHSPLSTTDRERDELVSLIIPAASGFPSDTKVVSYAQALAIRAGERDEGKGHGPFGMTGIPDNNPVVTVSTPTARVSDDVTEPQSEDGGVLERRPSAGRMRRRVLSTNSLEFEADLSVKAGSFDSSFHVSEYSNSDGTSGFNYSRLEEEHGKSMIAGPNAANGGGKSPDRYNTSFAENSSSSGRNNMNYEGGGVYFPGANLNSTDASNYSSEASTNKSGREEEREATSSRSMIETARPPSWDQFDRNRIYLTDQESCSSFPNSGQNSTLGTGSAHHDPCAMVTVSDLTDHPLKPHSLIFFLRVLVRSVTAGGKDQKWEVELEFEFDLLSDDAHTIVLEMKDCEELSSVPIDAEHITRLFDPFVKAANRQLSMSTSPTPVSTSSSPSPSPFPSLGLARAVIAEVLSSPLETLDPLSLRRLKEKYEPLNLVDDGISGSNNNNSNSSNNGIRTAINVSDGIAIMQQSNPQIVQVRAPALQATTGRVPPLRQSASAEGLSSSSSNMQSQSQSQSLTQRGEEGRRSLGATLHPSNVQFSSSSSSSSTIRSTDDSVTYQSQSALYNSSLPSSSSSSGSSNNIVASNRQGNIIPVYYFTDDQKYNEDWEGADRDEGCQLSDSDDELDEVFIEMKARHQDSISRIEKEFSQRWGGIQAQREKAEVAHKREIDFLTARKEDLDKQLEIMQEKFKERMTDFTARKLSLQESQSDIRKTWNGGKDKDKDKDKDKEGSLSMLTDYGPSLLIDSNGTTTTTSTSKVCNVSSKSDKSPTVVRSVPPLTKTKSQNDTTPFATTPVAGFGSAPAASSPFVLSTQSTSSRPMPVSPEKSPRGES